MRTIFEQGSFQRFYTTRLDEAMEPVLEHSQFQSFPTTVFISHKHDDLDDLRGVLGFLEKNYNVKSTLTAKTHLCLKNFCKNSSEYKG